MLKDKNNKKEVKNGIKRRKHKIKIEKRNRALNAARRQRLKYFRKMFIRDKSLQNFKKLMSVVGKMVKVNFIHKNKGSRLQRRYQLILNDNK